MPHDRSLMRGEQTGQLDTLQPRSSVEAVFGQALDAIQLGNMQEATLILQYALTEALHNQGYSAFQHLAQAATALLPHEPWLGCASLYAQALADEATAQALQEQAALWLKHVRSDHGPASTPMPPAQSRAQRTRFKLAYLLSQQHHHPLISDVIAAHDPSVMEVHLFANEAWPDLPPHVRLHKLSAIDLAATCRANHIDVAIDTGGLQPFAGQFTVIEALVRRIAPLQVGWTGCLASSGGLFDVLLADDVSLPPGNEVHFSERVVRLAGGQWCWRPPALAPTVAAGPFLARDYVTLGVVGRGLRLGPQFLMTLAEIMTRDPTTHVCFIGKVSDDSMQRLAIEAMLSAYGVATGRLSFVPWATRECYWQWLATVDLVLDTCPASGGLSLLDALWMGVPVVTCLGNTMGARQAASILTAIGLDRWIAKDRGHMVQRTLELINYPANLQRFRDSIRERFQHSGLLNGQRVARQIEKMVNTHMEALKP